MRSAGTHLIIDGYVKDASVFNAVALENMFRGLVDALGMTILKGPDFIEVPVDEEKLRNSQETGEFLDEGGITGTAIISTSHLSIHCWPLQKFFSLDSFSCKDFDASKALGIIEKVLDVEKANVTVLQRLKP